MLRGKFCSNNKHNIERLVEKGFSLSFDETSFCDFVSIDNSGNIIPIYPDDEYFLNKNNKISEEELNNIEICSLNNLDKDKLINLYLSKSNDLINLAIISQEMHRTLMCDLQEKFDNYKKMIISNNIC